METVQKADVIVKTRAGSIRGECEKGITVFRGIPYAAPPFGPNRLMPPRPVAPWDGVFDALDYGPKSPQPVYPPEIRMLLPELVGSGEDCLSLNIWTPDTSAVGLPVMVWIPGGMFEFHGTGACPWYDGSSFARDDVICVTINYRVGAEGFLYLNDGIANVGLLDQIAALEWVRDNIEQFGGSTTNVTIFGESAGAMSVAMLMAMPRAKGLFRRAIVQSGSAESVTEPMNAWNVAKRFAEKLGVEPRRESIAAVPIERFLRAQEEVRDELIQNPDPTEWGADVVSLLLPWQPVVDGDVLPEVPSVRIGRGSAKDVDLLIGTNTEETRLFMLHMLDQVDDHALAGAIAASGLPVTPTLTHYRTMFPDESPGDLLSAFQTDLKWRLPAMRLADAHAESGGRTFAYEFAWRSPQFGERLGACHAMEIGFVFDSFGPATESILGPHPPRSLAKAMHGAWVAFSKSGDPGWARYELTRRETMHFDTKWELACDPLREVRALGR